MRQYPTFLYSHCKVGKSQGHFITYTGGPMIIFKINTSPFPYENSLDSEQLIYCTDFYFLEIVTDHDRSNYEKLINRVKDWTRAQFTLEQIKLLPPF